MDLVRDLERLPPRLFFLRMMTAAAGELERDLLLLRPRRLLDLLRERLRPDLDLDLDMERLLVRSLFRILKFFFLMILARGGLLVRPRLAGGLERDLERLDQDLERFEADLLLERLRDLVLDLFRVWFLDDLLRSRFRPLERSRLGLREAALVEGWRRLLRGGEELWRRRRLTGLLSGVREVDLEACLRWRILGGERDLEALRLMEREPDLEDIDFWGCWGGARWARNAALRFFVLV